MTRYVAILILVTLSFYGGICALWLFGQHAEYFALLRALGVQPWEQPFLDMTGALSWGECYRRGVDVFVENPCDPLNRLLNYTPLYLALPWRAADSSFAGLIQDVCFLVAAPFVLRPRSVQELVVAIAAMLSTVTTFALERANLDVLVFVLMAIAGWHRQSAWRGRALSYVLFFLGGAIKLYPFALLLTVVREAPRVALAVGTIFSVLLTLILALYSDDFWKILNLLPPFDMGASDVNSAYRSDDFGAYLLPTWSASALGYAGAGTVVLGALIASFGAFALRLSRHVRSMFTAADWNQQDLYFLLIGSIVLTGCFLVQSNMSYRFIFGILLVPGLFDLRRRAESGFLRAVFSIALWLTLWCMWREMFSAWLEEGIATASEPARTLLAHLVGAGFFIGRELVWWFLASVMAAIVLAFVSVSPPWLATARPPAAKSA